MSRKTVEIIDYVDEDTGESRRGLSVDKELFDWSVGFDHTETEAYLREKLVDEPDFLRTIKGETIRQFMTHFTEFLGKQITVKELNDAIANGYIDL